jgi:transposase
MIPMRSATTSSSAAFAPSSRQDRNRTKTICYNKRLYRQRNCIERALGHLKINRAIATRYDQLADSFLGMLYLATARYWIKFVHAA